MGTAEEYRRVAWDCLKLAEATSNPKTGASLLNLADYWVRRAERDKRIEAPTVSAITAPSANSRSRAARINS